MKHQVRHRRIRFFTGLSAALVLLTAACSGAPSGSADDEQATDEQGSDEQVTLEYALWDVLEKPTAERMIAEFQETHPNIDVNVQVVAPTTNYWTKLNTSTTAGNAPDVFWMNAWMLKYYASNGGLLELQDKFEGTDIDMNNYVDAMSDAFTYEDKVYALPRDVSTYALCYNKELFEQAGVDFPDETWTWDDVITAAEKITDPANGVYGIVAPNNTTTTWYLTVPQAGGYIISPDGTTSGYDQPETIEGIKFWTDLIHEYQVSPTLQQTTDTPPDAMMTAGKIGMQYCGSWAPQLLAEVPYAVENIDMAPLPTGPDGNRDFFANGLAYSISSTTDHPEEAWEFLQFLGSEQAAQILSEEGTKVVAFKGAEDPFSTAYPQWNTQAFVDALADVQPFPTSINTVAWQDTTLEALAGAWTGESSVEDAARQAADEMNDLLAAE